VYVVPVHRAVVAALAAAGAVACVSAAVVSADDATSSRPAPVVQDLAPATAALAR
jgi:hypothetical protein